MSELPDPIETERMRSVILEAIRAGQWPGGPGGAGVQEYQVRQLDAGDVAGLYKDMLQKHAEQPR